MQSPSLLIIDDNLKFTALVAEYFQARGWEVAPAASESECWRRLKQRTPNVIVLDMLLRGTHGLKIAQSLQCHAAYRQIPILAITGLETPGLRDQCFAAGCHDLMVKPFTLTELDERLARLFPIDGKKEKEECA